ncbi:GIY-YIG nuclease family protein [Gammaproteobacteria bacterium]|jgi:hypothetical protein|nr:GIY-YIG nuclease family protein [Gammaproteobacteria bacterium]
MEYVYFAKSSSHPGMVKIGRTDRSVAERMEELSSEDYGPSNWEGDSDWEAVRIIKVEDNVVAEKILHEHFSYLRVEDNRELFYSNDIQALSNEAISVVNGTDILDLFDTADSLFSALGIVGIATGLVMTASIFSDHPNVKKAEKFMDDWEKRLNHKFKSSKSLPKKAYFGFLNWSFGMSKLTASFIPLMTKDFINAAKSEKQYWDLKKRVESRKRNNTKDSEE